MDPDETLALIRELCEKPVGLDTCEELQTLVTTLDEWVSRGGFLPNAWTFQGPPGTFQGPPGSF